MISRIREYDVNVTISLNPLNWRFRVNKYDWFLHAEAGPVSIMVLW